MWGKQDERERVREREGGKVGGGEERGVYRPAMKVLRDTQHDSLVLRDTFNLIPPLPRNLNRRLDRLSAGIHRQDHIKAEELGDELGEAGEDVVVEGARRQRQPAGLFGQGLDQLRVAVALVDGAVGRQEVEVVLALAVPHRAARRPREHDGQRVVVVRGVGAFVLDGFGRRARVVAGRIGRAGGVEGGCGGFEGGGAAIGAVGVTGGRVGRDGGGGCYWSHGAFLPLSFFQFGSCVFLYVRYIE